MKKSTVIVILVCVVISLSIIYMIQNFNQFDKIDRYDIEYVGNGTLLNKVSGVSIRGIKTIGGSKFLVFSTNIKDKGKISGYVNLNAVRSVFKHGSVEFQSTSEGLMLMKEKKIKEDTGQKQEK